VLAWALFRNGEFAEAREASRQALRLGTQNAFFHFHAGMIEAALGDRAAAATHLQTALDLNPHFSLRYAAEARDTLAALRDGTETTS
jgi:Flp pilus assembly protein TadD